jgi:hypothetical protein
VGSARSSSRASEEEPFLRVEVGCSLEVARGCEAQGGAEGVAHRVERTPRRVAARSRSPTRPRAPVRGGRARSIRGSIRPTNRSRKRSAAHTSPNGALRAAGRARLARSSARTCMQSDGRHLSRALTCIVAGARRVPSGLQVMSSSRWSTVVVASISSSPPISRTAASKLSGSVLPAASSLPLTCGACGYGSDRNGYQSGVSHQATVLRHPHPAKSERHSPTHEADYSHRARDPAADGGHAER